MMQKKNCCMYSKPFQFQLFRQFLVHYTMEVDNIRSYSLKTEMLSHFLRCYYKSKKKYMRPKRDQKLSTKYIKSVFLSINHRCFTYYNTTRHWTECLRHFCFSQVLLSYQTIKKELIFAMIFTRTILSFNMFRIDTWQEIKINCFSVVLVLWSSA